MGATAGASPIKDGLESCRLCGGSLTTGRVVSYGSAGRDTMEPVGDAIYSLPGSGAIDERRLRATLGE